MANIKLFSWHNEKPYFINDEGFEWYIDKDTTFYAEKKLKPLKTICFYVVKDDKLIIRALVGKDQQILFEDESLEGMLCKIDIFQLVNKDYLKMLPQGDK